MKGRADLQWLPRVFDFQRLQHGLLVEAWNAPLDDLRCRKAQIPTLVINSEHRYGSVHGAVQWREPQSVAMCEVDGCIGLCVSEEGGEDLL